MWSTYFIHQSTLGLMMEASQPSFLLYSHCACSSLPFLFDIYLQPVCWSHREFQSTLYVIISNCLHWSKCFKFELIDWLIECFDLSSSYHLARNQFFWLLASSVRLKYQRGNCSFCATAIHSCRFGETRRSVHKTRSTASYTYSVLIALFPLAPSTRLKLLVHWCHPSNAILWISLGWWRARLLSTESCAYLNIPLDRSGRN